MTSVLLVLLSTFPLQAGAAATPVLTAAASPKVVITELQTTGNSASEEFVEFYNLTGADIDFADTAHTGKEPWKLQFYSATAITNGAPDWTKPSATVSLTGIIPARGYYLLSSTGYAPGGIDSDQAYSSRLSDSGGGLQLVTATTTATTFYDRLMWRQSTSGQTLPTNVLATPVGNGSLQRLPNDDSEYVNLEKSLTQFTAAVTISPKDMWRAPEPPPVVPDTPEQPVDGSTDPGTDPGNNTPDVPVTPANPSNIGLDAPYLTELLPNPASPLKDETDEFIELYNPNDTAFDLKNYTLEVGTTTLHDFTFTSDVPLAPHGYTAFYSVDTHISLTNSGSQARLLDPADAILSETLAYDAADDGASWSLAEATDGTSGDTWTWSTTATPNAANNITAPVAPVKTTTTKAATAKTATTKKAAAKTASVKVKGTTKAKTTAKKTTKKAAKPKLSTAAQTAASPVKTPIHGGILVTVVGLAVLYAAYEYRHDIQNRFAKLRRHRAVRAYARQ
jgi:hypothetical protein